MVKSSFISSSTSISVPAPSSTPTIAPDPARVNSTVPTQRTGTELRQRFTTYLILQQKAPRTVEAYVSWIRHLAAFHKRSPDTLGNATMHTPVLATEGNEGNEGEPMEPCIPTTVSEGYSIRIGQPRSTGTGPHIPLCFLRWLL